MLISTCSLEDQVYAAYAVDDIHRAKVLLLKLKGIDVTSDDDPRIAAVQDEDFDFCFIPNGRLITDEEEKALLDARRREYKRRQWEEQMRACEYVWDVAKRKMREERLWLQRRRDIEERRRAAEDAERQRVFREREAVIQEEKAVAKPRLNRNVVSYDALVRLTPRPPSPDDSFVYHAMASPFPAWNRRRRPSTPSSSPLVRSYSMRTVSDDTRAVPFKNVIASMEGLLFPTTAEDTQPRFFGKDHLRQAELLGDLLGQNGEKSKARDAEVRSTIPLACKRCSVDLPWLTPSPSSSSISTCPSLTRSNSWLSYMTRSSESFSPATPPLPQAILPNWLKRSCPTVCRICKQQPKRLSVPLSESPLHCAAAEVKPPHNSGKSKARRLGRKRQSFAGAANVVMSGLSHLVDAAKQLQRAYMMAAVYHGAELDGTGEDDDGQRVQWRPSGTRARSKDVKVFLGATEPTHDTTPVQYIPLVSPFPPAYPPRTELPNPLPYQIVFKPHPPIRRSPYRLVDKESKSTLDRIQKLRRAIGESRVYDGTNLRVRLVGNPAYLRLKALQNVLYERGFIWEGHGNDCGFSSGKETLHGMAFEGIGPSLLSVY